MTFAADGVKIALSGKVPETLTFIATQDVDVFENFTFVDSENYEFSFQEFRLQLKIAGNNCIPVSSHVVRALFYCFYVSN